MTGILAAALVYFLPLDSTGKPMQAPQAGSRCWRIRDCPKWASGWNGQAICAGGSSEALEWLRKRRTLRGCTLGSEVR